MSDADAANQAADFLQVHDLEVLGALIGPQFSRIFAAIDKISLNLQRKDAWVVASSTYNGIAQFHCDATNDYVQIQAAVDACKAAGGGTVLLTEGVFNLGASMVNIDSANVVIRGSGPGTVIADRNAGYAFSFLGAVGTHIAGCALMDMTLSFAAPIVGISCVYTTGIVLSGLVLSNCEIEVQVSETPIITECRGTTTASIVSLFHLTSSITGGLIHHNTLSGYFEQAILLETASEHLVMSSNLITGEPNAKSTGVRLNDCDNCVLFGNIISGLLALGYDAGAPNAGSGIEILNAQCSTNLLIGNTVEDCWNLRPENGIASGIVDRGTRTFAVGNSVLSCGNLIANASCESATSPMILSEAGGTPVRTPGGSEPTWAADATLGHYGTPSWKLTMNSFGTDAYVWLVDVIDPNDMHGMVSGTWISWQGWFRFPAGSQAFLYSRIKMVVGWYDAGAWTDNQIGASSMSDDTFQLVDLATAMQIPATATGFRVGFRITSAVFNAEYCNVDDLRLWAGSSNVAARRYANDYNESLYSAGSGLVALANPWQTSIAGSGLTVSAADRILGRITAGAGAVEELTGAQARTIEGLATTDAPTFAGVIAPYLKAAGAAGVQLQDDAGNVAASVPDGGNAFYLGGAAGGSNRDFTLNFATDGSLSWGEAGDLLTLNKQLAILLNAASALKISRAAAAIASIWFNNSSGEYYVGIDASGNFAVRKVADISTTPALKIAQADGKVTIREQIIQSTNVIRGVFTKTLTDGVATSVFTITTTNETGDNDGGTYTCHVRGTISNGSTPTSTNSATKGFQAAFGRAMLAASTGVNSAVSEVIESASAATDAAQRDVGAVTMTVSETSEYVVSVLITAVHSGASAAALVAMLSVELVWHGFTTSPVMANA